MAAGVGSGPILKPMSVKAAAEAICTLKLKCDSVTREPTAVKVLEGDALHDCMREVQSALLTFVGSPESVPKVELRIAVLGDVGLSQGEIYKLTLEKWRD